MRVEGHHAGSEHALRLAKEFPGLVTGETVRCELDWPELSLHDAGQELEKALNVGGDNAGDEEWRDEGEVYPLEGAPRRKMRKSRWFGIRSSLGVCQRAEATIDFLANRFREHNLEQNADE